MKQLLVALHDVKTIAGTTKTPRARRSTRRLSENEAEKKSG
jgi:hypothetical protein